VISAQSAAAGSRREEIKIVAVLSLGFGLVGIDRFLISTLFPVIARDLKLNYGDIGLITGALAIAWGISALLMGNLSDRIGRRRVLTCSLIVFSVLIGASGLAVGLVSLIAVRLIMGFADGAYTPVSIAGTLAASPTQRSGLNIGIQQMMMPLFGLGFAPLFVAFALRWVEWRWIFVAFLIPGLALAYAMWKIIPAKDAGGARPAGPTRANDWKLVLEVFNVRLASLLMLCWLSCLVTTSAFMPNYLLDYLHLSSVNMGLVMSSIGLGATFGTLLLPWLSDRLGRKSVMIGSSAATVASLLMLGNSASVPALFCCLFLVHFFNNAVIALTVGPLSTESVPPFLSATASGLVIAVGELAGGGLMPVIVGRTAQHFGIEHVLWLPLGAVALGCGSCFAIRTVAAKSATFSGETVS
jgi:predicted MFS family arabinose efflux permease